MENNENVEKNCSKTSNLIMLKKSIIKIIFIKSTNEIMSILNPKYQHITGQNNDNNRK
jgi:hypothetical protein